MIEKMPKIALGTWMILGSNNVKAVVNAAIDKGYKHIDTAQIYRNEKEIGDALKEKGVERESIWITTKIWPANFKKHAYNSIKKSLERLQTKYIDTILLHASLDPELNEIAYRGAMKAREEGLVRTIGVSNFTIKDLEDLKNRVGEYPKYNQVVTSVKQRMTKLELFCLENQIQMMAYSSIRPYYNPNPSYKDSGLTDKEKSIIDEIAKKHHKSPADVMLKWCLQLGYVVLPKSSKPERVKTNFEINDFELSKNEIVKLNDMVSFSDDDFEKIMTGWRASVSYPDEVYEWGFGITPEGDKKFLEFRK